MTTRGCARPGRYETFSNALADARGSERGASPAASNKSDDAKETVGLVARMIPSDELEAILKPADR